MSLFARILVAADSSSHGGDLVQVARHLAERTGARLVSLTAESAALDQRQIARDDQVDDLRAVGLDAQYLLRFDRPAQGISWTAGDARADLVVMAPRQREGLAALGHRGAAAAMFSGAPTPLLILPSGVSGRTFTDHLEAYGSPVVVPLDGSALAERALPTAVAFATEFGQPLLLVRVLSPQPLLGDEQEGVRLYLDAVRQRIASTAPVNTTVVALVGMPVDEILWCAEGRSASLIVMSTHGRGGSGRAFTGSVAATIMRRAGVPLVIVPPSAAGQRPPALAAVRA
jgi:nucleotide-binding universal stress UspA family protein